MAVADRCKKIGKVPTLAFATFAGDFLVSTRDRFFFFSATAFFTRVPA